MNDRASSSAAHRWHARRPLFALVVSALVVLSGCAGPPDAATTKDSLSSVTEAPAEPDDELSTDALEHLGELEPRDCEEILVITARGTGEPSRNQLLTPVTRAITDLWPDADAVDLEYPASTDVKAGATEGVILLLEMLRLQFEQCPDERYVLLGYSQGALIVGDALSTPASRIVGETAPELDPEIGDQIAAVVFYGDPRFVGAEPYNRGFFDPDINGMLARDVGALDPYADRLRDFCVRRDFVCQSTMSLDEQGHVEYFDNGMQEEGATFVISQLELARTQEES